MLKTYNVYTRSELEKALADIITEYREATIIFHEDLFGFEDEDITIDITVDEDGFHAVANSVDWHNKKATIHSSWTFKDWVCAVCGW